MRYSFIALLSLLITGLAFAQPLSQPGVTGRPRVGNGLVESLLR
jgi:hypothetical protein